MLKQTGNTNHGLRITFKNESENRRVSRQSQATNCSTQPPHTFTHAFLKNSITSELALIRTARKHPLQLSYSTLKSLSDSPSMMCAPLSAKWRRQASLVAFFKGSFQATGRGPYPEHVTSAVHGPHSVSRQQPSC